MSGCPVCKTQRANIHASDMLGDRVECSKCGHFYNFPSAAATKPLNVSSETPTIARSREKQERRMESLFEPL